MTSLRDWLDGLAVLAVYATAGFGGALVPPLVRGAAVKVIFLDMDGVLNSMRFVDEMDRRCEATRTPYRFEDQVDDAAVARLNTIIERTGAVCVLSSSWRRLLDLDEMIRILEAHSFKGRLVGATPDLSHLDRGDRPMWRGDEIAAWIEAHPRVVRSLVILDDDGDMGELKPWLVRTDPIVGLVDEDVELAVAKLGEPGWRR